MAVPKAYSNIGTFYKYYTGEKKAPILTLFIGGNHEASHHSYELPFGGWAAPSIYYMGYSNVVNFAGLRIAGLSGIFKKYDYPKGHYERPPFTDAMKRSFYHVRRYDEFKLYQLEQPIDIFVSHDWPQSVVNYGDVNSLLKIKPFFRDEVQRGTLGSPVSSSLLFKLKPKYWFSGHLHVKYPAIIKHSENQITKFLALDKCLPRRHFLQVIEIPSDGPKVLSYDLEWLSISKSCFPYFSTSIAQTMPDHDAIPIDFSDWIRERMSIKGLLIPEL
eukprot:TRINITY_DN3634_c0_g1_i1.p1 TRINITY_DN3634_c0_g1~~TRINITY_DN3634_c0_g1_i1.p1  ORF type:complete len:274 (-),score=24.52 TRINITY_DN3634_c0_g1_i1:284-1105(-)